MERLKMMKENLMGAVQGQMGNLHDADAKELGEAIDMIKDLSEAIYYCTITEAMNKKDEYGHESRYYPVDYKYEPKVYPVYYTDYRDMDRYKGRMYYNGNSGGAMSPGGRSGTENYTEMPMSIEMRDSREGRSPKSRKMYMESKTMHNDKSVHLKELEKYMQELSSDIVEMIQDASPEEKQYLEKKLAALGNKIGQLS